LDLGGEDGGDVEFQPSHEWSLVRRQMLPSLWVVD
jgi:hypothetical protein